MKKGKLILIIISIVIILVVFIIGRYIFLNSGWKKINIENYEYNEFTTVELDLD